MSHDEDLHVSLLTLIHLQGISLTIDQYNVIMSVLPDMEHALSAKGVDVTRPDFSGAGAEKAGDDEPEEEDEKDDEDADVGDDDE